jgi:hypothetical protein
MQLKPFHNDENFTVSILAGFVSDGLNIMCTIDGPINAVKLNQDSYEPIWKSSCCEIFIKDNNNEYREYNLSFDSRIESYSFSDYRKDKQILIDTPPEIDIMKGTQKILLSATIPVTNRDTIKGNIAVVLEFVNGERNFWTFNHPEERPDFHNREYWEEINSLQ